MQLQSIFNPPGRHQIRISRLLQPFRAKTSIFIKKATFTSAPVTRRSPWIPTFSGVPKAWKIKEISFGGTLGVRNRSEAVVEGAQAALERPNRIEEDAQGAQEFTLEHSGLILERFEGVQSAPRIGRAESRSTFAEIDFFRLGDPLSRDFGSPETSQERFWALSGRSLGSLGRSWASPGERPPLGTLGVPFGVLFGASA